MVSQNIVNTQQVHVTACFRLALAISQLASDQDLCDLAKTFQEIFAKMAQENMIIPGTWQ